MDHHEPIGAHVSVARLTAVRLIAFKSFDDQLLPLDDLTILTGRNSGGKSNALDGLEVLSRLAGGEEITDALDGRRGERGMVRGGSQGCAPHGSDSFHLGCSVALGDEDFEYEVEIAIRPEVRVVYERLAGPGRSVKSGQVKRHDLMVTRPVDDRSTGLEAEIHSGRRGSNPTKTFRDSRLILTQLSMRVAPKNGADRSVLRAAAAVVTALKGVFHLDPVPHLMRDYVPERDIELRRTGENISAAVAHLKATDGKGYEQLLSLVRDIADSNVRGIAMVRSDLSDVTLALDEDVNGNGLTPAREMSDGLLRFIAIATALLSQQKNLDVDVEGELLEPSDGDKAVQGSVAIVIEEIENGLHPSQADLVLSLVEAASASMGSQVLVTTHSPALLNVVTGSRNRNVIVCYREIETGKSLLSRVTDLSGYEEAMASGSLGDLVSRDRLVRPVSTEKNWDAFSALIGLA